MVRLADGARLGAPRLRETPGRDGSDGTPVEVCKGVLMLGDAPVECYVLNTGERVIHLRSAVLALTGHEHGNLGEIVGVASLKGYLDNGLALGENRAFAVRGSPFLGRGLTADEFLGICRAFVAAFSAGALRTENQRGIALRCCIMMSACANVGLVALIDEATGYQKLRDEAELQQKFSYFFADAMRPWEKTFPDELWVQFKRITGYTGSIHRRPQFWGKLVAELIYGALDPDVLRHLKTHKPPPRRGQNWHQHFSEDAGLRALLAHIDQVVGIAKSCYTTDELRDRVAMAFSTRNVQIPISFPRR